MKRQPFYNHPVTPLVVMGAALAATVLLAALGL